jgi:hypothetical protein
MFTCWSCLLFAGRFGKPETEAVLNKKNTFEILGNFFILESPLMSPRGG